MSASRLRRPPGRRARGRGPRSGWVSRHSSLPPFWWVSHPAHALTRGTGAQGCCHHAGGEVGTRRAGAISPLSVDAPADARSECAVMALVAAETHEALSGISGGDLKWLDDAMGLREPEIAATGLDARTFALAKIAALIALDAPAAAYAWQVANAVDDGATP